MPAITEEMRQMEKDEANEEALPQAIKTFTIARRAHKATQKPLESAGQAYHPKEVRKGAGMAGVAAQKV
jgi:hypothetical protein